MIDTKGDVPLYDSQTDRPKVRIISHAPHYPGGKFTVHPWGREPVECRGIVPAADEALSCFFLYGGYAGEHFMELLAKFVAILNQALSSLRDGKSVMVVGTTIDWKIVGYGI